MMSRTSEGVIEPEVVRPRRVIRRPTHMRDYEVSYPPKQLAFADEQSDMISCMRKLREENRRMRQDMQRISDMIVYSSVLASQVSLSEQQLLNEGAVVSSTPKSISMQESFKSDGNSSQTEHTPLVPPRDESLLTVRSREQELIEELTDSLQRAGRLSDSPPNSGMSTPSYNDTHSSKNDLPRYDHYYDANVSLRPPHSSDIRQQYPDDSPVLRSTMPSHDVYYHPATDPYHHRINDRERLQKNAFTDRFDHSPNEWRQEYSRNNGPLCTSEHSQHLLGYSELPRPVHPPPMQYRGPTPTIPDFGRDDP
ncbi:uncharacterized protein LOC132157891 [Carassius carassius]|uniref:uncharacterized protein LOC132157891 n=1 Tax=Carassius carassius TaxID=217509 RepID=UPI00286883A1|nr:uncharacterized protein LOC132157891 [Carassius carassius]XP_059423135.1 uncharacterized protein LOC132157891 [Carassius carassius]